MKTKKYATALCGATLIAMAHEACATVTTSNGGLSTTWSTQFLNFGPLLGLTDDVVVFPVATINLVYFMISPSGAPTTLDVNFFGSPVNDTFTFSAENGRYENSNTAINNFKNSRPSTGPDAGKSAFTILGSPAGSSVTSIGINTIPEPTSAMLLGLLGNLFVFHRRRKS